MSKRHPNIEWFCITVIVTVLGASILPSLLEFSGSKVCARSPIRQSSAKLLIGIINRVQQVYYMEHGHFMSSTQQLESGLAELGMGAEVKAQAENNWEISFPTKVASSFSSANKWKISVQTKRDTAFAYAVAKDGNQKLYSYVGAITTYGKTDNNKLPIILCRTLEPSTVQPAAPILQKSQQFIFWQHDAKLICSSGTEDC
jgi:hypothetical protein